MATTVYHGCRVSNIKRLISGKASFPGLYVTDTVDHATRYANAQATRLVSTGYVPLVEHAAVVTLDTTDAVVWRRRGDDHSSLDVCETTIKTWRVVAIEAAECSYQNCTCHKDVAAAQAAIEGQEVEA